VSGLGLLGGLAALAREERPERVTAFLRQDARGDLDPVVQAALVDDVEDGTARARLHG